MTSPTTTDAQRLGSHCSLLIVWLCCMIALLGATAASAQTPVNPTTNTILFSGQSAQDPQNHNTDPVAGIIMQGTATSAFTPSATFNCSLWTRHRLTGSRPTKSSGLILRAMRRKSRVG